MVTFNDADEFFQTAAQGGNAFRFEDIDGIGPKTASKIKSIRGVNRPQDVEDYSAEELAEKANISQKRAAKAIQAGGGNPSFSDRGSSGTVAAGNLADQLDSRRERAVGLVEQRRDVFEELVETGEDVPERRQRKRDPDANPFLDRDPDEVRQVGQAADIFSEATADPIDPTAESPDLGFDEQDRELAAQVRLAAQEALEEQQDVDFDEASSQTSANTEDPPEFSTVESVLSIGGMMTVGQFEVSESEYEEAQEEFAQQSPEAKQVDKRRRAPITTNEDRYARAPGRLDFPGVDTPTQDPKTRPKDFKRGGKPRTTEVDEEREVATGTGGFDKRQIEREIDGETVFASEIVDETPTGFGGLASAFDVSLTPGEAFEGVGAVGVAESDKYPNIPIQDETGRYDADPREEQEELDQIAAQRGSASKYLDSDNSPQAIADIYEQGEFDISLSEFGRRVRREKRTSDLPGDLFDAAQRVAQERGAFPAFR